MSEFAFKNNLDALQMNDDELMYFYLMISLDLWPPCGELKTKTICYL